MTRVQSFLQAGRPDHDVLLYYPFYDSLAVRGNALLTHFGGANPPADGHGVRRGRRDCCSAAASPTTSSPIASLRRHACDGRARTGASCCPASRFIPLETFERILALAQRRRDGRLAQGTGRATSQASEISTRVEPQFTRLGRDGLRFGSPDAAGISEARVGRGVILRGDDLERAARPRAHRPRAARRSRPPVRAADTTSPAASTSSRTERKQTIEAGSRSGIAPRRRRSSIR